MKLPLCLFFNQFSEKNEFASIPDVLVFIYFILNVFSLLQEQDIF